jgi:hypothetical protein
MPAGETLVEPLKLYGASMLSADFEFLIDCE